MNSFLNILLLLLFVTAINYFMINVFTKRYIRDKLIIFISIFFFQMALLIISKILNNCKIDIYKITNECLRLAFVATLGYTVYVDLTLIDSTKAFFAPNLAFKHKSIWLCIVAIILFISAYRTLELLLQTNSIGCQK